jgi:hypothetical protein
VVAPASIVDAFGPLRAKFLPLSWGEEHRWQQRLTCLAKVLHSSDHAGHASADFVQEFRHCLAARKAKFGRRRVFALVRRESENIPLACRGNVHAALDDFPHLPPCLSVRALDEPDSRDSTGRATLGLSLFAGLHGAVRGPGQLGRQHCRAGANLAASLSKSAVDVVADRLDVIFWLYTV